MPQTVRVKAIFFMNRMPPKYEWNVLKRNEDTFRFLEFLKQEQKPATLHAKT